jgi:hypothetical protein
LGYGDAGDVIEDVRDRWGESEARSLRTALDRDRDVAIWNVGDKRLQVATTIVHRYVPVALYLDYLEEAVDKYANDHTSSRSTLNVRTVRSLSRFAI